MAISFSGEFATPRTQEEVFDFLSNPNKFAPLLPDFQSMSMEDERRFTVKVKVGVGNIKGTAEIKMELAELARPNRALYLGQGTAVGSQVRVSAGFDLQPTGESTKVVWQGEANVFGKLASMAGGMLEPLGRKNIQKLIDGLQKALAEPVAKQNCSSAPAATPEAANPPQLSAEALDGDSHAEVASPNDTNASVAARIEAALPAKGADGSNNSHSNS